jgi:hypothetical protein
MAMSFLPSMSKGATLLTIFKAFPETYQPLIEFHEVLLRGPSPLTEGERELIADPETSIDRENPRLNQFACLRPDDSRTKQTASHPTLGEINKRAATEFYAPMLFNRRIRALVRFLGMFP